MYRTMNDIVGTSLTIPFTPKEMSMAIEAMKVRRAKGTDLSMGHPMFVTDGEEFTQAAAEGVVFMHSPSQLNTAFMFIKFDAGRSFFGKQKAVYASYIGDLYEDRWMAGTTFKFWGIATTSIGNVYRGNGFN